MMLKKITYKFWLVLIVISMIVGKMQAQIAEGGIPEGIKNNIKPDQIVEVSVPIKAMAQSMREEYNGNYKKKLTFGFSLDVDLNPQKDGSWRTSGKLKIWTIAIRSSGAKSLSLILENYQLKTGEKLFIYNDKTVLGAFTKEYNKTGVLSTELLSGDIIYIEFSSPNKEPGSFSIKKVVHDYYGVNQDSGACNINIICPEGDNYQTDKKAVMRIMIGNEACTGTLINNTAKDGKALVLTANHCISSDYEGERAVFYFNYESTDCKTDKGAITTQVLTGAKVRSTNSDFDYCIIELNQIPPVSFKPYYAGWSLNDDANLTGVACIHHPWGDMKKISLDENKVTTGTYTEPDYVYPTNGFWEVGHWEKGTTERGSSGSALLDNEHLIIGSLVGGQADCTTPNFDYFEKFKMSFYCRPRYLTDTLAVVLDPLRSNTQKLYGYDPYVGYSGSCDTISNIYPVEEPKALTYEFGTGFYSGHNSDSIQSYAEQFSTSSPALLYGAFFNVAKAGSNGQIIISVLDGENSPGNVLYEKYLSMSKFKSGAKQFVDFFSPVKVNGKFYISYTISYNNSDTFAIAQAPFRNTNASNTAWLFYNNQWISYSDYSNEKKASSLGIEASYCNQSDTPAATIAKTNDLLLYPNPVKNRMVVELPDDLIYRKFNYWITDITGKVMTENTLTKQKYNVLDLSFLSKGFYIIFVNASGKTYSGKILKE